MSLPGALQPLLAPRSVAVVGASADPARIGGRTLRILREGGFPGPIHPVNPARAEIQGLACHASVADLPGPVDCAILAIPAPVVPEALRACAARGVRAAIVLSGGFAEAGGAALQEEIAEIAGSTGLRVLGPNCVGLFNAAASTYLTFFEPGFARLPGRAAAIVSQSGGYGAHVVKLAADRGLPVSHCVTTGNEADVEIGDVMLALADDPAVAVLVAYVEGIRTPGPFLAALKRARLLRKPVVLMKCGTSAEGARAAASHTASMAGADLAYDLVFRRHGVHRARSTEEVLDIACAACAPVWPGGRSLAILTNSGGMGVQIADHAVEAGLSLAAMPAAAQEAIAARLPQGSAANPIDVTAQWLNDEGLIAACAATVLEAARPDVLLVFMGASVGHPTIRAAIAATAARFPDQPIVLAMPGEGELARHYQALGCFCLEEPARAVRAIAALGRIAASFDRPAAAPGLSGKTTSTNTVTSVMAGLVPAIHVAPSRVGADSYGPHDVDCRGEPGNEVLGTGLRKPDRNGPLLAVHAGQVFDEHAAKRLLAAAGIASAPDSAVPDVDAAVAAASAIGGPVALKVRSPDLAHKSDVGGVALDLVNAAAIREAAAAMLERIAAARPGARIEGFLVTPMLSGGVECIIGLKRDALFGPMVMVGMGGVLTELLQDTAWSLAPVTLAEAEAMVAGLRMAPLLHGFRGRPGCDLGALAQAVVQLSRLGAANADRLEEVEVNPLLVRGPGQGVVALDALVRTMPA